MSVPLKTYLNRCRCCLEPFESNEDPAQITDFFEIQYYAFTRVELKPHDLLSKYVCEYCHLELVRFSVWKKDLIEKQKSLYKLLNQHIQEDFESDFDDGEIIENNNSVEISDEISEELAGSDVEDDVDDDDDDDDDRSSNKIVQNGKTLIEEEIDELMETDEDGSTEVNEETTEIEDDDTYVTTENESDADFVLSRSMMNRNRIKATSTQKKDDLRCEICKSTFLGRQGLVRHVQFCKPGNKKRKRIKGKAKIGNFRCFCKERFISHRALNIHRTRAHGKNSNMSWDMVNDNDEVIPEVTRSRATVSNQNNNNSNKSVISKSISTTQKKRRQIKCKYCSFHSLNNIVVFNHMRKDHDENVKPECIECNKSFSCTTALKVHINDIHLSIRPHTCLYCKANFKQLVHLKDHMLSIHKALHKPYCCACGESFCTLKALKLHKLQEHKHEDGDLIKVLKEAKALTPAKLSGRYICMCTREFAYPSRLTEHQRHCKQFKNQAQEVVDAKANIGAVKSEIFKCFKCGRIFNNKSNLIRHQKSSGHLDAQQLSNLKFQCTNCDQKFFSQESLSKHVKINSCHILDSD